MSCEKRQESPVTRMTHFRRFHGSARSSHTYRLPFKTLSLKHLHRKQKQKKTCTKKEVPGDDYLCIIDQPHNFWNINIHKKKTHSRCCSQLPWIPDTVNAFLWFRLMFSLTISEWKNGDRLCGAQAFFRTEFQKFHFPVGHVLLRLFRTETSVLGFWRVLRIITDTASYFN